MTETKQDILELEHHLPSVEQLLRCIEKAARRADDEGDYDHEADLRRRLLRMLVDLACEEPGWTVGSDYEWEDKEMWFDWMLDLGLPYPVVREAVRRRAETPPVEDAPALSVAS